MSKREFYDPAFPQVTHRGVHRISRVRSYMIGSIEEPHESSGRWVSTVTFLKDNGSAGGYKPLKVRGKTQDIVRKITEKIAAISQVEATAYTQLKEGNVHQGDFNRETGVRNRELLKRQHRIDLPDREWDYHHGYGLTFRGTGKLF